MRACGIKNARDFRQISRRPSETAEVRFIDTILNADVNSYTLCIETRNVR